VKELIKSLGMNWIACLALGIVYLANGHGEAAATYAAAMFVINEIQRRT